MPVTTVRMAGDHLSVAYMGLRFGTGMATAREIGIRIALGAERRDVVRVALKRGMVVVLWAVVIGLTAAFAIGRALSGALLGVSPADPVTFGAISLLLGSAAFAACYIPARSRRRGCGRGAASGVKALKPPGAEPTLSPRRRARR